MARRHAPNLPAMARAPPWHGRCTNTRGIIMSERPRVIIALSDRAESAVLAGWLAEDGFEPVRRPTPETAQEEMRSRPYDVLIADTSSNGRPPLRAEGRLRRAATPAILIGNHAPQRGETVTSQPIYLARPLERAVLNCYLTMAMLEGSPVRRSERKMVSAMAAVVNGVPAHILDVSVEGVRIEMLREKRAALPPYFTVRVPMMGVGVNVRRVWAQAASGAAPLLLYGGSLVQNRLSAVQGWKSFIETIPTVGPSATLVPKN
jgi:hypothetical protein